MFGLVLWKGFGLFCIRFGECLRVLAPHEGGSNVGLVRLWSHAVVVSQQGISLLEGRVTSTGSFFVAAQASHYQPSVLLGYLFNAYARYCS